MSASPDVARQPWRKASRSNQTGGDCVELRDSQDSVDFRDSKNPNLGHLRVPRRNFSALVSGIQNRKENSAL